MRRAGVCLKAGPGIALTSEEPRQNVVSCRTTGKFCGEMPSLCHRKGQLGHEGE
jgi:hypothetical protein